MTTNIAELMKFILKKTINLPISSTVMATYTNCNKFFMDRGRKVEAMVTVEHVYSDV